MADNPFDKSIKLAENEKAELEKHLVKISKIVQLVEDVLIDYDCTWLDWHEVIEIFNKRNDQVIPQIKIKEIKQRYDKLP